MHKNLLYAGYGWLVVSGLLHFVVDVVLQYVRGKRLPSAETTLYYGLNTSFALGQVVFGLLGLLVARRALHLLDEAPAMFLALAAGAGWLLITFFFMQYWEPKVSVALFLALMVAALLVR